ncbi:MAG: hypothetical protein QM765_14925 [Myxococcales bacterium]
MRVSRASTAVRAAASPGAKLQHALVQDAGLVQLAQLLVRQLRRAAQEVHLVRAGGDLGGDAQGAHRVVPLAGLLGGGLQHLHQAGVARGEQERAGERVHGVGGAAEAAGVEVGQAAQPDELLGRVGLGLDDELEHLGERLGLAGGLVDGQQARGGLEAGRVDLQGRLEVRLGGDTVLQLRVGQLRHAQVHGHLRQLVGQGRQVALEQRDGLLRPVLVQEEVHRQAHGLGARGVEPDGLGQRRQPALAIVELADLEVGHAHEHLDLREAVAGLAGQLLEGGDQGLVVPAQPLERVEGLGHAGPGHQRPVDELAGLLLARLGSVEGGVQHRHGQELPGHLPAVALVVGGQAQRLGLLRPGLRQALRRLLGGRGAGVLGVERERGGDGALGQGLLVRGFGQLLGDGGVALRHAGGAELLLHLVGDVRGQRETRLLHQRREELLVGAAAGGVRLGRPLPGEHRAVDLAQLLPDVAQLQQDGRRVLALSGLRAAHEHRGERGEVALRLVEDLEALERGGLVAACDQRAVVRLPRRGPGCSGGCGRGRRRARAGRVPWASRGRGARAARRA